MARSPHDMYLQALQSALPHSAPAVSAKPSSGPAGPPSVPAAETLPGDEVLPGRPPGLAALSREAREAIFGGSVSGPARLRSEVPTRPVLTEKLAGWKAQVTGSSNVLAFPIQALDAAEERLLVTPLEHWAGGSLLPALVVEPGRGPVEAPVLNASGNSMTFRPSATPGLDRVYLTAGGTTRMEILDGSLQPVASVDLRTFAPKAEGVVDFLAGEKGAYVATNGPLGEGWNLSSLDPRDGTPRWTHDLGPHRVASSLAETPDGRLVVLVSDFHKNNSALLTFAPDGRPGPSWELPFESHRMLLAGDRVFLAGHRDMHRVDLDKPGFLSRLVSSGIKPEWKVKGEFRSPQFTPDGKVLVAADTKSGFYRSHSLQGRDPDTGEVVWERERYGELYLSHRVLSDGICVLSAVKENGKAEVRMARLDLQGNEVWQASLPGEFDEYETVRQGTITSRGEFVLGGHDGFLYFVRPRKDGDSEADLRDGLDLGAQAARKALEAGPAEAPAPTAEIQEREEVVVIGDIHLEKRAADR